MEKEQLKISSTTSQTWKKPGIGFVQIFKEFCESTSLHGYSYLYNANSITLKCIWSIVILFMTGIGIYLSFKNTIEYLNAGIVTNIESSTAPLDVRIIHSTGNWKIVIHNSIFFRVWYFLPLLYATITELKPLF